MVLHASESTPRAFPCTRCGACCKHVGLSDVTRFLDRGDGACRHFDDAGKICSIYERRPNVCRVDDYYVSHYVRLLTWEEFIEVNLRACATLAAMDGESA
ncbi:MAG: YkgJ family cysteine cluster protein [Pandoraea sp.]|nr:YkgJ family cysteine cluster protein [Pandoraea sp.]MDR3397374.1 YkgJ family cysteine cluster protein [Pandoraea sp.]